jgi:AraC-like DNA-binding protein
MSAGPVLVLVSAHSAILGIILRLRRCGRPGDRRLGEFLIVLALFLGFYSNNCFPALARIPALDIGYVVLANALAPAFYLFMLEKSGLDPVRARWSARHLALPAAALLLGLPSVPWLLAPPSPALIAAPPLHLLALQRFADLEPYRFQIAAYLVSALFSLRNAPAPRWPARCALVLFSLAWAIDQIAALVILLGPGLNPSTRAVGGSFALVGVALLAFGLGYIELFEGRSGSRPSRAARRDAAPEAGLLAAYAGISVRMEREHPWLDPELSLASLSRSLGMAPRELSRAINAVERLGFKAYINKRRVDEAKALLLSRPDDSILDIALESGFNSKSAFNRAFKELCGETPSGFKAARP